MISQASTADIRVIYSSNAAQTKTLAAGAARRLQLRQCRVKSRESSQRCEKARQLPVLSMSRRVKRRDVFKRDEPDSVCRRDSDSSESACCKPIFLASLPLRFFNDFNLYLSNKRARKKVFDLTNARADGDGTTSRELAASVQSTGCKRPQKRILEFNGPGRSIIWKSSTDLGEVYSGIPLTWGKRMLEFHGPGRCIL